MGFLRGYFLFAILLLGVPLVGGLHLVSTEAAAAKSKTIRVGKLVVQGMAISVELEAPKVMQMMMKSTGGMGGMGGTGGMGGMGGMGEWKTYRPKAGTLTHHLTVVLADPESGQHIPAAKVSASIVNKKTGKKMEKKLPPMFGKNLIYGANIFLKPGKYDLIIKVGPPRVMRVEGAINKWLKPIQAKFAFDLN